MIVGISGKLGSGKDTVADLIRQECPSTKHHPWKVIRFADRLKEVVATLTQTTLQENHSREGKQSIPRGFPRSLGSLQQQVGMALRTYVDPNIWVTVAMTPIRPDDHVVIPDVRFPNEAEEIKRRGGLLIRVEGDPANVRGGDARNLAHPSETALDAYGDFDVIIYNNSTLDHLLETVSAFFNDLKGLNKCHP